MHLNTVRDITVGAAGRTGGSLTGRQVAFEKKDWGNGVFTKALIEGLDVCVSERVKDLTGGRSSPVTQAPGGVPDFPLAVAR